MTENSQRKTDAPDETTGEAAKGGTQTVRDLIEKTFLLGVGAAVLTKERVEEVIDEFVRRGQLSREEGRDMVNKLVDRSKEEARSFLKRADSTLQGTYRELGLLTRKEAEDLEFRLRQLEHRVQ
ncbi:MAG: hypothetical protein H5T84_01130, partial [Thermoleophilia bacterium]|nr:hypothetical protein [Thermoleophilia bacterium]